MVHVLDECMDDVDGISLETLGGTGSTSRGRSTRIRDISDNP